VIETCGDDDLRPCRAQEPSKAGLSQGATLGWYAARFQRGLHGQSGRSTNLPNPSFPRARAAIVYPDGYNRAAREPTPRWSLHNAVSFLSHTHTREPVCYLGVQRARHARYGQPEWHFDPHNLPRGGKMQPGGLTPNEPLWQLSQPYRQFVGLNFKRPFGTRALWASYPALKRRAILGMSLRDKAPRRPRVGMRVKPDPPREQLP
jgi:hypothetical protein